MNDENETLIYTDDISDQEDRRDPDLIGRMYKKQFAGLKDEINKVIAAKIKNKIDSKRKEFIDNARLG